MTSCSTSLIVRGLDLLEIGCSVQCARSVPPTFLFTKPALPALQRALYGRIINISPEAGRLGSKGGAV
jgi:hypothetical protein